MAKQYGHWCSRSGSDLRTVKTAEDKRWERERERERNEAWLGPGGPKAKVREVARAPLWCSFAPGPEAGYRGFCLVNVSDEAEIKQTLGDQGQVISAMTQGVALCERMKRSAPAGPWLRDVGQRNHFFTPSSKAAATFDSSENMEEKHLMAVAALRAGQVAAANLWATMQGLVSAWCSELESAKLLADRTKDVDPSCPPRQLTYAKPGKLLTSILTYAKPTSPCLHTELRFPTSTRPVMVWNSCSLVQVLQRWAAEWPGTSV